MVRCDWSSDVCSSDLTEDCWWWVGVCDCWAAGSVGGRTPPWVDCGGGRARRWCWGLDMQPTLVVLGVHGSWWAHVAMSRWLWWKGASLVVGTRHVANACCVGRTLVLVDARRRGSMAVVEGRVLGGGDSSCSQRVLCWAYMGVGGRTSPWVDCCGGRARRWCWGVDMQPTRVVLGVRGY